MRDIVAISGRWARLQSGDLVTAIQPAFRNPDFEAEIAAFQQDPEPWLRRMIVARIPARKTCEAGDVRAVTLLTEDSE